MELRPGYKQTEVAAVPDQWEVKPLSHISPRQSVGLVINPSTYFVDSGTVPMLVGSDVSENSINWAGARRISETSNRLLPASRLKAGDLVTVRVGEPGVTAVVPPELDGCNCASMMIVRQHPSFDSHWLCFAMNSQLGRSQVAHVQYGTAQKQFNISHAVDFRFAVPPLPEQRAIAAALSDVDALLGALERLIAKKRDLKQAAMQQLLTGKTRLPGFHGEWKVMTLHEVCQKIQDGTHFSPKPGGNDYLYVTSKNIRFGTLDMSTAERISAAEHFKIYARCDVKKGDLLLTKDGANTGNAALNSLDEPFSLLSSVAMLRFDSRHHVAGYYMHQLLSNFGQVQIKEAISGNAITRLTLQKIRAFRFPVAPFAEQTAIAEVLSEMEAELAGLEQRRNKTRALKQAMMQELLTGRTRLV